MDKAYSLMAAMMIVLGAVAYGLAARVWSPPGGLFGFSALEVVGWNLLLGLLGCLNASPPMLFDGACSLGGCDMYVGLEVGQRWTSNAELMNLDTAITAMSALMIVMLVPSGRYWVGAIILPSWLSVSFRLFGNILADELTLSVL